MKTLKLSYKNDVRKHFLGNGVKRDYTYRLKYALHLWGNHQKTQKNRNFPGKCIIWEHISRSLLYIFQIGATEVADMPCSNCQ